MTEGAKGLRPIDRKRTDTMPRIPVKTALPGAAHINPSLNTQNNSGTFIDKNGTKRNFKYCTSNGTDPFLTIVVEDESMCTFKPWEAPFSEYWSASGLVVITRRVHIATAIYAAARDILALSGSMIAPSDNLFEDGVVLWKALDPGIEMEEQPDLPGYFRPKL